jgi:hypothetical protein
VGGVSFSAEMNKSPLSISTSSLSLSLPSSGSSPSLSPPSYDEQITIFSHLIIEEFLRKNQMTQTLENFQNEWKNKPIETISHISWINIALKLHLPSLINQNETKNQSIIEHILNLLLTNSAIRMRTEPEVLINGLAEIPRTKATMPIPPLPPLSPCLKTSSLDGDSSSGSTNRRKKKQSDEDFINEWNEEQKFLKKYQKKMAKITSNSSTALHSPIRHSVPNAAATTSVNPAGDTNLSRKLRKNLHPPTLKPSTENWIPEVIRFRSIHRDLATLDTNLKSTLTMETELNRELRSFQLNELDKSHLEEELGVSKKLSCGCCLQSYSQINLPMTIPMKAVIDIRKKWSHGKRGWWSEDDERIEFLPKCYEGIKICLYCSQFFHQQDFYRPSFDSIKKEQKEQTKNELKRLEKEYWDPLKMIEKDRSKIEALGETNGTLLTGMPLGADEVKGVTSISLE